MVSATPPWHVAMCPQPSGGMDSTCHWFATPRTACREISSWRAQPRLCLRVDNSMRLSDSSTTPSPSLGLPKRLTIWRLHVVCKLRYGPRGKNTTRRSRPWVKRSIFLLSVAAVLNWRAHSTIVHYCRAARGTPQKQARTLRVLTISLRPWALHAIARWRSASCAGNACEPLAHEPHIRRRKLGEIREHEAEIGWRDAEPARKRRAVLINGGRRQPSSFSFGVAGTAQQQLRIVSVKGASLDRVSDDEMVTAPRVVGAAARRGLEGASKIGERERGHLPRHTERGCGIVERLQRRRQVGEQRLLAIQLIAMSIEAPQLDEEYLSLCAGDGTRFDHLGGLE